MTGEKITHITIDEIRAKRAAGEHRTDWARVDALTDEEIEAAMRDDPDWKDHIDEDWSDAELVIPSDDPQHVPTEVGAWDGDISDWEIDHSTGRPILTYKKCSVIEAEDAEFVLRAIRAALFTAAPVSAEPQPSEWIHEKLTPDEAWELLCNSDDRTSPEEYPDHALITKEELASYMERAVCAPKSAEPLALAISRDRLREKIASDPDLEVEVRSPSTEPKPQCCMCGKKGLSTAEGDGGGECELTDGRWTCSQECWERAVDPQPVARRWFLGSMNDGLFIINTPPRPSNDDVFEDRSSGPTLVLKASGLSVSDAQAICDAHNSAVTSPSDLAAENARLREALAPFAAEADEHDGASGVFTASVPIEWLRAARAAQKGGAE